MHEEEMLQDSSRKAAGVAFNCTKRLEMERPLPMTPDEWLDEIKLAIADAEEAKPFGRLTGTSINEKNLFHLAPLVCLKFRGRKQKGREAQRVTEVALANYVANTGADADHHGLEGKPLLTFALCYVAAHLALDLVDTREADAILTHCDEHLD